MNKLFLEYLLRKIPSYESESNGICPATLTLFYFNLLQIIGSYTVNMTIQSEDFLRHFMITGSKNFWEMILISSGSCTNQTGCECGNYQFYKETCKLLRDECSSQLACSNPIQPSGHCCHICGRYSKNQGFKGDPSLDG